MWKICKANNKYLVSDSGEIMRISSGKVLHQYLDRYGYKYITLEGKKYKVHRLVAETYIGAVDGFEVDHIDTNRTNNKVENLRIVTRKENANNPLSILNLKKHGDEYATKYGREIMNAVGNRYPSIIEASRSVGVARSNIQYHLRNRTGVWFYV